MKHSFVPAPLTATDMLRLRSPVDPEENFFTSLHDDIQMEIFRLLDFADLVHISQTCTNFRKQVKGIMKNRAMVALGRFFGSYTDEIINLLQFGRGCISGHVVTAIFNLQIALRDFPKDIRVFVTRRGRRVVIPLLKDVLQLGPPKIVPLDESTRQLAFGAYKWDLPVCAFHVVICALTDELGGEVLDGHGQPV